MQQRVSVTEILQHQFVVLARRSMRVHSLQRHLFLVDRGDHNGADPWSHTVADHHQPHYCTLVVRE